MTQSVEPTPGLPTVQTQTESSGGFMGFIKRVFGFLWWVISGFGLFAGHKDEKGFPDRIVVYSVHHAFYLWFPVVLGFVGSAIVRWTEPSSPNPDRLLPIILGWMYVFSVVITIVTLIFDFSTWKFLLIIGGFLFIWLLSKFLENQNLPIIGWFVSYMANLHPRLDPGFASVMSWSLLFLWLGAAFHSFVRGRKTFMPNAVEEWHLGEGREIIDRQGVKFRTRYRDVLEAVLGFGAGDIEAYDTTQHVVKRWENIVFLAFKWRQLDTLLHERMTYMDNEPGTVLETKEQPK